MSAIRCRACGAHLATISARLLDLPQHPAIIDGIITDHQAYCGPHTCPGCHTPIVGQPCCPDCRAALTDIHTTWMDAPKHLYQYLRHTEGTNL